MRATCDNTYVDLAHVKKSYTQISMRSTQSSLFDSGSFQVESKSLLVTTMMLKDQCYIV